MSSALPLVSVDQGDLLAAVLTAGRRGGLDRVGCCDASPFDETRAVLEERAAAGLHGGMQFTYRNPARSTDPSRTLPGVRSLVVGALGYAAPRPEAPPGPHGRVARYATEAHYDRLRVGLDMMADVLRQAGHRAVVCADDNALVDRAAAVRAGLGWSGKSANVLLPGHGSWFVLGSVLTDAVLTDAVLRDAPASDAAVTSAAVWLGGGTVEVATHDEAAPVGCGSCTRCLDRCPTGAIVAPGVVDARRCLAWHVQQEGDLPHEFRVALGDRLYGCDECQEVCPPSRREETRQADRQAVRQAVRQADQPRDADLEEHDAVAEPGTAVDEPGDAVEPGAWIDLRWVLRADDSELLARLGRWYIPRRDPRYLRRNALVALANSVADAGTLDADGAEVEQLLGRYLDGADDLLVGHAAWAAWRTGRTDLLDPEARRSHPAVVSERARWPRPEARDEDGPR